jgi:hypothetical protein
MEKEDYEAILKQKELDALDELLDFLRQLPYFKHWSKRGLAKMHFYFERMMFNKNQSVVKAGDFVNHVYIIKSGEYEVKPFSDIISF